MFGGEGATIAGKMFYPLDKIVFASDCPFDPEKGPMYIRETIRLVDKMDWTRMSASRCITRTWSGHGEDICEVAGALMARSSQRPVTKSLPGGPFTDR